MFVPPTYSFHIHIIFLLLWLLKTLLLFNSSMAIMLKPIVFVCVLISLFFITNAQTCKTYTFSRNRLFSSCIDLPVLNSFLHWTYNPSNRTVNLAFRKTSAVSSNWVAWAINPTGTGMIGAQALVAYQTGGRMSAYTSPVSSYSTKLQQGDLSFPVPSITAELSNNEMIIFANLVLPPGNTSVNQVWQEGPLVGGTPAMHALTAAHRNSKGTIDFLSTKTSAPSPTTTPNPACTPPFAAGGPSSNSAPPIAGGPPSNSAPTLAVAAFSVTLLSVAATLLL